MTSSVMDGDPANIDRSTQNLLESSYQLSNALTHGEADSDHNIFQSAATESLQGLTNHSTKRPRLTRESVFRFGRSRPQADTMPASPSPPPAQEEKLAEVRTLLDELRLQLMAVQSDKAMLESTFAAEKAELLRSIHEEVDGKTEAESRAVYHFQQVDQLRKSLKEVQNDFDELKMQKEIERRKLSIENSELKEELQNVKRELDSARQDWQLKEAEYKREQERMKATIEVLNLQNQQSSELLKAQLEETTSTMSRLAECEKQLQTFQSLDLNPDHLKSIEEELHSHVANAHRLERENGTLTRDLRHYKAIYQNVEKLREEKYALEHQLRSMTVFKDKAMRLEVENAILKRERAEWASFLENAEDIGLTTPYAVCRELASLRSDKSSAASLQESITELTSNQEALLADAEKKIIELHHQVREKENLRQVDQVNSNILVKDKQLLQKEINILREQLKSYDIEEITYMSDRYDSAKSQRLNELEGLIGQYRTEIEALRTMMTSERTRALQNQTDQNDDSTPTLLDLPTGDQIKASLIDAANAKINLAKELSAMQSDLKFKTTELEALKKQAEILQNALIFGGVDEAVLRSIAEARPAATANTATEDTLMIEDDQPKQRILQFKDNPASREQAIRQSLLDNLRKENQELIARLQQGLESNDMDDDDGQPQLPNQSFVNLKSENAHLNSTIAQKEKRIMRMQQVWVTKVREYHEAVASLLGYKVDFSADGMVRLASMYADPNDISFVFKSSENDQGTLKIVGANKDDYMKTLESSYNYCVVERGSIPAFLSAVTMELIDYQKHDDGDHEMLEEEEEDEEHEVYVHDDDDDDDEKIRIFAEGKHPSYNEQTDNPNYVMEHIDESSEDNMYAESDRSDVEEQKYAEDEPLQEYVDTDEEAEEDQHTGSDEFDHDSFDDQEEDDEDDEGDDDAHEQAPVVAQEEPIHYVIDDDDDDDE